MAYYYDILIEQYFPQESIDHFFYRKLLLATKMVYSSWLQIDLRTYPWAEN